MVLTDADYATIGGRWLYDQGYTNLAVRNPWGLPGTNENQNYAFGPLLAQEGRKYVDARLGGAPASAWEEFLQGRLFAAGVRDGINVDNAADQFAAQYGFANADLAKELGGVDVRAAFHAAVGPAPAASDAPADAGGVNVPVAVGVAAAALGLAWWLS